MLRARFACGVRELQVSAFQAAVLLLFSDLPEPGQPGSRLAYADVAAATRIEAGELRRTLQSLACGKVRVLLKWPRGREVCDGDAFEVNDALAEPRFRVRVNAIQAAAEGAEEDAATSGRVLQDRLYQVDAAIVRIMKARRRLGHGPLLNELMAQLKFPARREDLKKRVESLLEREYLERDPADPTIYVYLA